MSIILFLIGCAATFLSGVCAGIAINQFEKVDWDELP